MRLLKMMPFWLLVTLFGGCSRKTGETAGKEQKLEPADFMAMFRTVNLPVIFGDSSLYRKHIDSNLAWRAFSQFIPDTLIQKNFGKFVKPKLYAAGRLAVKNAETYLFVKALSASKKVLYVLCFDKKEKFRTGMPLVIREDESEIHYTSSIDNKYAISVSRHRKNSDRQEFFVKTVYVYNDEGGFTLIMRESNEGKPKTAQIYNPIDTLGHKHKFTGDYLQDKRNFVSFRDGKNSSTIRFFVHFEKDNGNCKGELKGDARFVSSTIARYGSNGDPCSLEFSFNEKNVKMKELEGCGNHRDIRCYFDGIYIKHKEVKVKPGKTRHHPL